MLTFDQLFVGGTYWCNLGDGEGDKPIVIMSMVSGHIMIGIYIITDSGKYVATINRDWLMEHGSVRVVYIDPCEDIICNDICFGYDLWSQKCVNGICVKDAIVESNSDMCGYVVADDPTILDMIIDNKEIVVGTTIAGIILIRLYTNIKKEA